MRYTVEQIQDMGKEYFESQGLYLKSYCQGTYREIVYQALRRCTCGNKLVEDNIVDVTFYSCYKSNKEIGIDEPCAVVLVIVTCICDCGKVRTKRCEVYTQGMLEGE